MTIVIFLVIGLFTAMAIPQYVNLNRKNEANQCRANQVIVETALALAYAESLTFGKNHLPQKLSAEMFEDGKIPTCPVDGKPIEFNRATGQAFCPNHISSHARSFN